MKDPEAELGDLQHLVATTEGFRFKTAFEVRRFVANSSRPELAAPVLRFLTSAAQTRGRRPYGVLSLLFYSMADAGSEALPRLKRQLFLHQADVVCLQGFDFDAPRGPGQTMCASFAEEGYELRASGGQAILWNRTRWALKPHEAWTSQSSILALVLVAKELPTVSLQVLSLSEHNAAMRIPVRPGPLLLCGPLDVVREASGSELRSAFLEVLGAEVATPRLQVDAVLFQDLEVVAALSGHTPGYFSALNSSELQQQFPACRVPLVAAFDLRSRSVADRL